MIASKRLYKFSPKNGKLTEVNERQFIHEIIMPINIEVITAISETLDKTYFTHILCRSSHRNKQILPRSDESSSLVTLITNDTHRR